MNDDDIVLYIITLLIVVGTIILLLVEYVFKKWNCKPGGSCEKSFGGKFGSVKDCLNSKECTDSPDSPNSDPSVEPPIPQKIGYNCVNDSCQESTSKFAYSNIETCEKSCPKVEYVSYSYPYYNEFPYGSSYSMMRRFRSPRRYRRSRHHRRSRSRRSRRSGRSRRR